MKKALKLALALLGLCLAVGWVRANYYGPDTFGGVAEVEEFYAQRYGIELEVLKTAENGHIGAALADHIEEDRMGVMVYEKTLFGLRWRHRGMDYIHETGELGCNGSWLSGGPCDIIISGDNRSGLTHSYILRDLPEISRTGLEADYILDIYISKGLDDLPERDVDQYAADGSLLRFDQ